MTAASLVLLPWAWPVFRRLRPRLGGPPGRRGPARPGRVQPAGHRRAALAARRHRRAAAGHRAGLGAAARPPVLRRARRRPGLARQRRRPGRRGRAGRPGRRQRRGRRLPRAGREPGWSWRARCRSPPTRSCCARSRQELGAVPATAAATVVGYRPLPGRRRDAARRRGSAHLGAGRLGGAGVPRPRLHGGRPAAVERRHPRGRHHPGQPAALPGAGGQRARRGRCSSASG